MREANHALTVGILADVPTGMGGGVGEFCRALVRSLVTRADRGVHYVVFVAEGDGEWVPASDHLSAVGVERTVFPQGRQKWHDRWERHGAALRALVGGDVDRARYVRQRLPRQRLIAAALARSPRRLDLVHFPFQDFVPTNCPAIFCPWDVQHHHLPEFHPSGAARTRDAYYRQGSRLAARVVFGSEWSRDDVSRRLGIPREKTVVIPIAAPTGVGLAPTSQFCAAVSTKYRLPERFVFYPAVTWKHKNHARLISALAEINRTSTLDLHLVCCGACGRNVDQLQAHAHEVGMDGRVHFLGYIDTREVRVLYRLALLCAFPSLFEGAGLPILEAFEEGCPLAAARVTCIPEYAGDAALLFDPTDVGDMARVIGAIAASETLRRELVARGRRQVVAFGWDKVCDAHVALFRQLSCVSSAGNGSAGV